MHSELLIYENNSDFFTFSLTSCFKALQRGAYLPQTAPGTKLQESSCQNQTKNLNFPDTRLK